MTAIATSPIAGNVGKLVLSCLAHADLAELYCLELPELLQQRIVGIRRIQTKRGWTIRATSKTPMERMAWLADVQQQSLAGPAVQRLHLRRCEVAAEFIVESQDKADRLHTLVARWASLKWPGRNRVIRYLGTTYWSRRTAGRNVAAYSSRASKLTGQPACRVEVRLSGAAGRSTVADLSQLVAVNPRRLFRRCFDDGPLGLINLIPEELVAAELFN